MTWRALAVCATFLCICAPSPTAFGQSGHPELVRRVALLEASQGVDTYARLRELWQAWELADPTEVEAVLAAFSEDTSRSPPLRAYAGLLEAYARRRRGDLSGATRRIAQLGFVRDWLVVGPFDNDNKAGLKERHPPEIELSEPILFERSMTGKERPVRWRRTPDVHTWGFVDLGAMLRPQQDICAYATSYVRGKPRELALWVGATGAVKLFWGTDLVLEDAAYRQLDADRRSATVVLREGYNRLTVKVCGDESAPSLALRIAEADGSPAVGLDVNASDAAAFDASSRLRQDKSDHDRAKKPPLAKARGMGPLDHFDTLGTAAATATELESHARYLMTTGGDPEGQNLARDLARRAAEADATVPRLLMAASLAEDRNKRAELVGRADALAKSADEQRAVLLERAALARTGPNWRDAVPLYERLVALDPMNVPATLGKVDVYVEAGLKRTALAVLERAVEGQPSNVALLRSLAAHLRALGRDTEASEVEARYAALRFDDGGYLAERLDLAVARRDGAGARRWGARLLSSEPASAWAHATVARGLQRLGDSRAAVATYQRALDVAPEDVDTMRAMADLYGAMGSRDQQLAQLKHILRVVPQAKDVRAYLEHAEPSAAREDERLAWPPERFLEARAVRDDTHPERTLRQLTVMTVFDNGLASQFRQVVFQSLSDEAAARGRQYAFTYHADRQIVQLRAARVFRKDGRIDEAIESGTVPLNDPSINMYTLQRTFYVQFPRLESGDVVELRYRIEDVAPRNEMSDTFAHLEYLQSEQPIGNAELVVIVPKNKKLHVSVGPRTPPRLRKEDRIKGDKRVLRWELTDVVPIASEPLMPRHAELLTHVHVSTFASWEDVGAWYWRLAREMLDADDDVRALAKRLVDGFTDERAKVAAIYHYAASETRYVALELGIEGIKPRRAALTLARGWGDCKDKATLIVSLLREVGIDAELVLVRTGQRGGLDTTTASIAPFDHAIAYVPSLDLYLDGTAEATGTLELPAMDRSSVALRITGGRGKLVTLPEPAAALSREEHEVEQSLAKDGEIDFEARVSAQGVEAPLWRKRYHSESTRRERVASDLASSLGPIELLPGARGLTLGDLDALEKPVVLHVAGKASAKKEGAAFSVPMAPEWSMVARFASRSMRVHDVLVGPLNEHREIWTLRLPPGMKALSMPDARKLTTRFGEHETIVRQEGDKLTVQSTLRIDRARVRASEYAEWRAFCERVDAGGGARVLVGAASARPSSR